MWLISLLTATQWGETLYPLISLGQQIYAFFFLIGKGILIEGIFAGMEREVRPVFLNEVLILEGRGSLSSDL